MGHYGTLQLYVTKEVWVSHNKYGYLYLLIQKFVTTAQQLLFQSST